MATETRQMALGVQLRDHSVFDTYHDAGNEVAVQHLRELADGCRDGIVFVWGDDAVGKTHLLQAACSSAGRNGRRSAYLCPDIELAPAVLDGWSALALVCLDDLHRVAGDASWERALLRLFNDLRDAGGSLLCAAERNPLALPWGLADLASRLRSGPVYRLASLGEEDRLQALRLQAGRRGLDLPEDTARFMLRRCRRDMRSLYQTLDDLDRASLAAQRRLTVPFVRGILGD